MIYACANVGITPFEAWRLNKAVDLKAKWLKLALAVEGNFAEEQSFLDEIEDQMSFHTVYMNERAFWDSTLMRQLERMGIT